jgi:hypothetical protein
MQRNGRKIKIGSQLEDLLEEWSEVKKVPETPQQILPRAFA